MGDAFRKCQGNVLLKVQFPFTGCGGVPRDASLLLFSSFPPCSDWSTYPAASQPPFQPWKGGARYHAFFFLHFRLAWVVQGKHKLSHPSTSSTVLAREGFASGGLWPPGVLSLPFQAL